MKNVLEDYCLESFLKGLLLLSMPTGFGKTHQTIDFIFENFARFKGEGRLFFFITNLKKNLPYRDLRKRFVDAGMEKAFDENVLFIDSNSGTVMDHLLSLDAKIPDRFKVGSYSQLKSYIKTLSQNNRLSRMIKDSLETKIRKTLEPAFRRFISDDLHKRFKSKRERLAAIRKDPDYQWIGQLYPAVFTDEKTVLFLSMDKFFRRNTTLVERSYYFHEQLIENAVIFIDEFDATKESVLRSIIEAGVRHRVDLLDLFLNIHNHSIQSECPEWLLKESMFRIQLAKENSWPSLRELVQKLDGEADRIFKKYNLQHTCKSHQDFSSGKRNFLFHDYQFHHVLDARNKRIELIKDKKNRANWIMAFKPGTTEGGTNIRSMLGEISGFLTFFQRGIGYLAQNYVQLKREDDSVKETFPLESAVRTVLNNFHLDAEHVAFFSANIMEGIMPFGSGAQANAIHRQGFYDAGFRYYDIVDNDDHDTLSKIYMYNFSRTPESFLKDICMKAMVVGISATAGVNTNIGNYDLEYLRSRLGSGLIRITGKHLMRLKAQFKESTRGYENIKIKPEFIGMEGNDPIDQLEDLLHDREASKALQNSVAHANPEAEDKEIDYLVSRYLRILSVWNYFLDNPEINVFLCLLNKLSRKGDPKFDLDLIRQYANLIQEGRPDNLDVSEVIVVLSGENFEAKKKAILDTLGKGERRFILSAYQTVGAGQNLQYPIPESMVPVKVNDFPERSEMDINAIYLDRPTNLLVNIFGDKIDDVNFIKYLFQLEFLIENGAIPLKAFKGKLDEAFHRYVGRKQQIKWRKTFHSLYDTEAYTRFLIKLVIQAIGRICRTNMKAHKIHVLADSYIRKHLALFTLPEDIIPVREFAILLEAAGDAEIPESRNAEFENRASVRSSRTSAFINRMLKTPWNHFSIKMWKALRFQTLEHPTHTEKGMCDPDWNPIYIELPSAGYVYRYTQKHDYGDTEIFFTPDNGQQEVSERAARLPELMAINPLKGLFETNGWATEFPKGELMLTPAIFNNIYKGALGEVCGQHILEEILGIKLQELEESEFELFDFKTSSQIYVDFKLWKDNVAIPADEIIPKIRAKMKVCRAKRVYIINILGTKGTRFHPIKSSDGRIIEVPFLCQENALSNEALTFILEEFKS